MRLLFEHGLRLVEQTVSEVQAVEGAPDATAMAEFRFEKSLRSGTKNYVLRLWSKSFDAVREFGRRVKDAFTAPSDRTRTLSDIVNQLRRELKEQYQLSEDELKLEVVDELGNCRIVLVDMETTGRTC